MNHYFYLIFWVIVLVCLAAFFSASETAMMTLNRYRIRHLARSKNKLAYHILNLIEKPDRLLAVIIIGSTFANILASSIATLIAFSLFGNVGVVFATLIMTLILLIFGEITPKTLAAMFPEKISFIVCLPLLAILKIIYPFVWLLNLIANTFLKCFGVKVKERGVDVLSFEELRTILRDSTETPLKNFQYQNMMMGVLDLNATIVDDIKVPRQNIIGINLVSSWEKIIAQIVKAPHHRLPVYRDNINDTVGILNLRRALTHHLQEPLTREKLQTLFEEPYYIPTQTPLNVQLYNFKNEKKRLGLIVDEYGEIQGLITLDDILEEIVGEYTTNLISKYSMTLLQPDGSYLLNGNFSIRELNRQMNWNLPVEGPNTLSGLIIDYLESIPQNNLCVRIAGYPFEILEVEENRIKLVKIYPSLYLPPLEQKNQFEV